MSKKSKRKVVKKVPVPEPERPVEPVPEPDYEYQAPEQVEPIVEPPKSVPWYKWSGN